MRRLLRTLVTYQVLECFLLPLEIMASQPIQAAGKEWWHVRTIAAPPWQHLRSHSSIPSLADGALGTTAESVALRDLSAAQEVAWQAKASADVPLATKAFGTSHGSW